MAHHSLHATHTANAMPAQGTPRVALIGEALIDHLPDGDVIGGAPFNVARNLSALGVEALMLTRIGEDSDGRAIRDAFDQYDLPLDGLQVDPSRASGNVEVRFVDGQPQYTIRDNQAWDAMDRVDALSAIHAFQPAMLAFGSLAQRSMLSRETIRSIVESSACKIALDLNLRNAPDNREVASWSLNRADLVKVNDDELAQLITWFTDTTQTDLAFGSRPHTDAIKALVRHFAIPCLIVTRGAQGYAAYDGAGELIAQGHTPTVKVVDTVGAGDAFFAIVLLGELKRWPLTITLDHAVKFAAAVCTLHGAVSSDPSFYAPVREWLGATDHALAPS